MSIRISIVDDHSVVREGLINILHLEKNIEVINEFEDGETFINYLVKFQPQNLCKPLFLPDNHN